MDTEGVNDEMNGEGTDYANDDLVSDEMNGEGTDDVIDNYDWIWEHIRCYNHTMQLAVTDTTKDAGVSSVISKVCASVGRYSRSAPARESLRLCQISEKVPEHELIQMVVTRWDCCFDILPRYIEQKPAIIKEHSQSSNDCLKVSEWKLVEGYVDVLREIKAFTAELGSHSMPTLSMVIPVLYEITTHLEQYIKTSKKRTGIMFARKLLANVKSRFPDSDYQNNELYQIAMLVDPRFKSHLMTSTTIATELLVSKAFELKRLKMQDGSSQPSPSMDTSTSSPEKPQTKSSSKWGNFKKLINKSGSEPENRSEEDLIRKQVSNNNFQKCLNNFNFTSILIS